MNTHLLYPSSAPRRALLALLMVAAAAVAGAQGFDAAAANRPVNIWQGTATSAQSPNEQKAAGHGVSSVVDAGFGAANVKKLPTNIVANLDNATANGLNDAPRTVNMGRTPLPETPSPDDYAIDVELTTMGTSRALNIKHLENNYSFAGFKLSLRRLSDGSILKTKGYDMKSHNALLSQNNDVADRVADAVACQTREFINTVFPLYATFVNPSELTDDNSKTARISVGNRERVWQYLHFDVCKAGPVIKGHPTSTKLGCCYADAVDDDGTTVRFLEGRKAIKAALSSGATIFLRSRADY